MSQLKVDNITDELGTGAPDFPNGLTGVVPASSITGALNATGSAPIFACRAWVNFNGTGTVAIRASGNVSSITDNGTGDYTVNFTTALPDANFSATVTGFSGAGLFGSSGGLGFELGSNNSTSFRTSGSVRIAMIHASNNVSDAAFVSVAVFR